MTLMIDSVLDPETCKHLRDKLRAVPWRDGEKTAGQTAAAVKSNEQADLSTRTGAAVRDRVCAAVQSHPVLRAASQPDRFSPLLISRARDGGAYGLHYDNPFMGAGAARIRTDLSYTLFLSAPDSYEGGALTLELPGETKSFRGEAGSLLLYPSTLLHRVEPVTAGERIVAVGWIESRVRQAERREILFDLENLKASLSQKLDAQSPEMLTLGKVLANLKRTFS